VDEVIAEASVLTAFSNLHEKISKQAPRDVLSWEDIGRMWNDRVLKNITG
jgi:hypothetical protein